jgi:hypothetical protein
MDDEGDKRKYQQNMNERTHNVKNEESSNPCEKQY